jgi:hypothetical protein
MRATPGLREPVISCKHIFRADAPILCVFHERPSHRLDSGWSVACGREDHTDKEWMLVGMWELTEKDPSIREVLDLPEGQWAERDGLGEPWQRWRIADLP